MNAHEPGFGSCRYRASRKQYYLSSPTVSVHLLHVDMYDYVLRLKY